jgi:Transglutaminase-like superfamily
MQEGMMRRPLLNVFAVVCCLLVLSGGVSARTLILEGRLDGSVAMRQSMEFSVSKGPVSTFSFRFALPATYSSKTVNQNIEGFEASIFPRPASSVVETDRFGNRFQRVSWENISQDIRISLDYTALVHSELTALESKVAFPLKGLSGPEAQYLISSDMVQSGNSEIAAFARQLSKGVTSEYEAVMAVTNWVADNIKYTFNPPQYDAAYTLATKSGNCQNFAHLSIALLRSIGIPARIVGGITLKNPWKVPIDDRNSIVQSMGQGGHAWLEVWFPDLGWLPYDPQQSKQFTSSRHIKQSHGIDSRDINDTWRGAPYLPAYTELIEGRYLSDSINLKVKRYDSLPRPYLMSNLITASVVSQSSPVIVTPKPEPVIVSNPDPVTAQDDDVSYPVKPSKPTHPSKPVKPLPPAVDKKPAKVEPKPATVDVIRKKTVTGSLQTFGNMEFPALVNHYNVQGDTGTRVFERETSEYVTSRHIYAQAVYVKDKISLEKISLAMHKFGGDGTVYIDLVKDNGGKPDILQGIRSNLLDLERIHKNRPGYYWVDFTFPYESGKQQRLLPGKYWIVLRHSGEAILNWFFTPGKPYGEGDDTRSTVKGFQWEDILNYDFVFKVTGRTL